MKPITTQGRGRTQLISQKRCTMCNVFVKKVEMYHAAAGETSLRVWHADATAYTA